MRYLAIFFSFLCLCSMFFPVCYIKTYTSENYLPVPLGDLSRFQPMMYDDFSGFSYNLLLCIKLLFILQLLLCMAMTICLMFHKYCFMKSSLLLSLLIPLLCRMDTECFADFNSWSYCIFQNRVLFLRSILFFAIYLCTNRNFIAKINSFFTLRISKLLLRITMLICIFVFLFEMLYLAKLHFLHTVTTCELIFNILLVALLVCLHCKLYYKQSNSSSREEHIL